MAGRSDDLATLRQRALQFLVHSFLYYKLGEPVVKDAFFDRITEELRKLREDNPKADMPYADIIDPALGPEASGFTIREYPPQVISTAFKLLYATSEPDVEFSEFVERRGYQAILHPKEES
jgi:NAD-dependent DNA ligase